MHAHDQSVPGRHGPEAARPNNGEETRADILGRLLEEASSQLVI